jgi:nicotinamidase-related amidase
LRIAFLFIERLTKLFLHLCLPHFPIKNTKGHMMASLEHAVLIKSLDPATTALVLIDLQQGIVGMTLAPRPGNDVVEGAKELASKFRKAGAPVVAVHVGFSKNYADALSQPVDKPNPRPATPPEGWSEFIPGLVEPNDITILKRQWGAFHGTELDLQLRRRGVKTIVLAGIATNMGVESTARVAWELGYNLIVLEDLCSSRSAEMHSFAMKSVFPLIGMVAASGDIAFKS